MARAGYCSECRENVWLTPDGGCARGHGAGSISGAYDVPDPEPVTAPVVPSAGATPAPPSLGAPGDAQEPPRKKSRVWIVVLVVILVLCGCCAVGGILTAIAIPTFTEAQSSAEKKVCFANERTMESALEVYKAENDGEAPSYLEDLVTQGMLQRMPVCPAGGEYSLHQGPDGTDAVVCSKHGHY